MSPHRNSALRRARRTARNLSKHFVDPETGEIMSLRIKQNGQRMSATAAASTPKAGAGTQAAQRAIAACCPGSRSKNDRPVVVYEQPVPVTYRKRRTLSASAVA